MLRLSNPRLGSGMLSRTWLLCLFGCVFLLAEVFPAAAQRRQSPLVEPLRDLRARPSLSYLLGRAETIVAGEVTELESAWTDDRSAIYTTVTLRVDRRFTGAGSEVVQFRTPGGTVDDRMMMVTHAPQFRIGERTLVFLSRPQGRLPRVVGGQAGKRHVRVEEDGSETFFPGFALAEADTAASRTLSTLDELAVVLPRLTARPSR